MVIFHSFLYVYQRFYPTKTDQIHAENPLKSTSRSCDLRTAQFPGGPASVREELRDRLEIFEAQLGWEIPWKSMETYRNLWQSMEIYGNLYGNLWKSMEIYGNLYGNLWKSMEIYGNLYMIISFATNGVIRIFWFIISMADASTVHIKKTPESPG